MVPGAVAAAVLVLSSAAGFGAEESVHFKTTAAETAAGVVPQDPSYPAGNLMRYGAVGDGVADDAPAFVRAMKAMAGGTVVVPVPRVAYLIKETLTIPENTTLAGENKQTTKLLLGANTDMMILSGGAQLYRIYLDGNGATFTGRGLVFPGHAGNQTIQNARIINFNATPVAFTTTEAGSRVVFNDVEAWQTGGKTTTGKFAFTIPDEQMLAAHPRKFTHIETAGFCAFSFGGSNDVFISDSFLGDLQFSPNSRAVQISATRLANQRALTIDGANHTIVGNDIAGQVTLAPTLTNSVVGPNSMNAMPIIDHQVQGSVQVTHFRQPYEPTVSSERGEASLGNGKVRGIYSRAGSIVEVSIELTVGSSTRLGEGPLRFSLPVAKLNADVIDSGAAVLTHGNATYTAVAHIPGKVDYVSLVRDGSGAVTPSSPASWGAGDTIRVTFVYNL
jgi:hypothetical protein